MATANTKAAKTRRPRLTAIFNKYMAEMDATKDRIERMFDDAAATMDIAEPKGA